jgi:hypothetical protein
MGTLMVCVLAQVPEPDESRQTVRKATCSAQRAFSCPGHREQPGSGTISSGRIRRP